MASKVLDLIYWRDVRTTGLVFTGLVVGFACLFQLSAISVLSNLGLGILAFTLPVRLLYKVLELVRLNNRVHPFQPYLDEDSSLTDEDTVRAVEHIVLLVAFAVSELKRLFLVDSIVDSVKFLVLLYLLTYVGVQTNGLTLMIIGVICVFSLPLSYKLQQERIATIYKAVKTILKKIKNLFKTLSSLVKLAPETASSPALTRTHTPKLKVRTKRE
ncbi:reticulon-2b [Chanos chanos]|uniref:Reticulon n=1 Tax=Chanos chanos TaxID=29144 RepID=A0A6J2W437_CHACN|nr:reticulon-2-like [Chanos chanos]